MTALMGLDDGMTVAMLRDAYNMNSTALMGLADDMTVQDLRMAYDANMMALMELDDDVTVQMLRMAYDANMMALMELDDDVTVQMLRMAYDANMMALDGFDAGTTVAMLRAAYMREMYALDGLPDGMTLADLRAFYLESNDLGGNLDAREDAMAILRLTGADGTAQDSEANLFDNDGITETGGVDSDDPLRAPDGSTGRPNPIRTIWLGCSKVNCYGGTGPEDDRITKLRGAVARSLHGDVVRSGSMISFDVLEGIATDLNMEEDGDDTTTPLSPVSRIMAGNLDTSMVMGDWVNVHFDKDIGGGRDDEIIVFSNAKEVPFGNADSKHPFNRGGIAAVTADPDADPPVVGVPATPHSHLFVINDDADGDRFDEDDTDGPLAVLEFTLGPNDDPTVTQLTKSINYGEFVGGTFGGIQGRFTCQPTAAAGATIGECRIRRTMTVVTEDGQTTTVVRVTPIMDDNDEWWFKPLGDAMVTNADYMIFGAWLTNADDPGGARAAGAFADGGVPYDQTQFTDLTGTATYTGPAAGQYAERTAGTGDSKSGQFTAMAELTADFGETGGNDFIEGMIDEFRTRLRGGSVWSSREWLVELERTMIDDEANGFTVGDTSGRADSHNWVGRWGVEFFGATTAVQADGTVGAITPVPKPSGVAGTFSASSGNPHPQEGAPGVALNSNNIPFDDRGFVGVVGGFGAEYVAPPMMEDDS
jgi:hypothetical protein